MPSQKRDSEKATIYDVAERAGVAISTVSRVVNDSSDVSEATRERVRRVIEELNFRPSRTAKTLAQSVANTIAVAVPTFTTPFHNELLKGVRAALGNSEIDLLLCDLAWAAPKTSLGNFLDRAGAMDGLLLAGLKANQEVVDNFLNPLGAPTVLVGSRWDGFDSFYWDDEPGARLAVEHLIELGHTRIGMITTPHENRLRNARERGYRQALEAAGITFDPSLIASGKTRKHDGFSEEAGYEAMQQLLAMDEPVTGIFASSDVQAIGAWQAIREAGKEVPDDFSLVGYDDIKMSRFIGLTSIAQNMHDVGEEATSILLERTANKGPDIISKLIAPELRARKSTRPHP
ncbi:LacI family DNA-binding transcriptional regulator [Salisaeta longa]|uniref:LacI family DNA-binding transcriptional regulator n=1 Tax=Salisaeta longa TaxID=503170 RepID=UPI0003B7269D|nr:LacI family DNA-binding transcriptional regulator [Salisaeta longa]